MIKIEKTDTYGWEAAIRGMRNPMNSWDKSDSWFYCDSEKSAFSIGKNDTDLMMRLAKGGSVHAKYRRMITVTCDITAPLYWWKEFDTYKVGTVANSCSTMHRIHAKEFTLDDFSHEHLSLGEYGNLELLKCTIMCLNAARQQHLEAKKGNTQFDAVDARTAWWQMIQLLPSSYNQKRTVSMTYEVLVGMYRDRKNHKLDEWCALCEWIKTLPYSEVITNE